MTPEEASRLVLSFARVLYVNGQSTDETVEAGERLVRSLGLRAEILPRWGELQLEAEDDTPLCASRVIGADPSGVNMTRVASATGAVESIVSGKLPETSAGEAISAIAK